MKWFGVIFLVLYVAMSQAAFADTPTWEKWERDNSIAHHGSFLVIDQPDKPFCYIKQSYYDNTDLMELTRIKGKTHLTLTFLRGIVGNELSYWVDSGEKRSAVPDGAGVNLAESVFDEMKAGSILYVEVTPVGEATRTQEFRLNGFTASVAALQDSRCGFNSQPEQVVPNKKKGCKNIGKIARLIWSIRQDGVSYSQYKEDTKEVKNKNVDEIAKQTYGVKITRDQITDELVDSMGKKWEEACLSQNEPQ